MNQQPEIEEAQAETLETSKEVAKTAGRVLRNKSATKAAKTCAASALAQARKKKRK